MLDIIFNHILSSGLRQDLSQDLVPMIQLGWPEGELQDSPLSAAPELGSSWSLMLASLMWLLRIKLRFPTLEHGINCTKS